MYVSKKVKTSLFSSTLVLILLVTNFYIVFLNLGNLKKQCTKSINTIKESEWYFIQGIIEENIDKSRVQGDYIAENTKSQLYEAYSNDMQALKYDIENLTNDSRFQTILSKNINGKYLNIENDNNDIWVASLDRIIYDKSINCSKNGELRTWDVEISMHWNKELAKNSIDRIINQETEYPIFWEYLTPKDKNHIKITYANYDNLKNVFLKEGINGLKTYEFLVPIYINKHNDILNIPDVDNLGQNNNNNKIIITQGFSVYDQITNNHKDKLNKFNNDYKNIELEYENSKQILQIEAILMSILMFSIFLCAIKIQNLLLEESN